MVCLIKPQFEAGREKVGKKGVVRDPKVHQEVIVRVLDFAKEIGFVVRHLGFSPIKGPEGNIEYLVHLEKGDGPNQGEKGNQLDQEEKVHVDAVVAQAHETLS